MRCLYQKDERALPGNLLNRKSIDSFFLTLNVVSFTTSPLLSLSLSLSFSLSVKFKARYRFLKECICVFRMVLTINSDCFPKQH
jgi:hypothetical protein